VPFIHDSMRRHSLFSPTLLEIPSWSLVDILIQDVPTLSCPHSSVLSLIFTGFPWVPQSPEIRIWIFQALKRPEIEHLC